MKNKIMTISVIVMILGFGYLFLQINTSKKQESNIYNKSNDEKKTQFEVCDITATSNEEITINIKMVEDSEFVAGNFELLYDTQKMEYIKYENGEILEGAAMSIVNNDESNNRVLIAYVGNPQSEINLITKGELIKITFKLKETVSDTEINPQFECSTLKDREGNDIKSIINQGTITVK